MTQPRFHLIKVADKCKLNPITWIGWHSSVCRALGRCSRDCWFELAVRHYFSSNNIFLEYVFTCGDSKLEWLKRNQWNRVCWFQTRVSSWVYSSLRMFYGRYGDLIKQYDVSLSQMLNDILWPDHIQWQHPTDQTLYRTRPFTEFWVVSIEYLRRVWHADRGRLLRTPGPVPFGLAYILLVETNPLPNLSLFYRTMLFEYPSYFLDFACKLFKS